LVSEDHARRAGEAVGDVGKIGLGEGEPREAVLHDHVLRPGAAEGATQPRHLLDAETREVREVHHGRPIDALPQIRDERFLAAAVHQALRYRLGSMGTPGPMVLDTVTLFTYTPLAAEGLARTICSMKASRFSFR